LFAKASQRKDLGFRKSFSKEGSSSEEKLLKGKIQWFGKASQRMDPVVRKSSSKEATSISRNKAHNFFLPLTIRLSASSSSSLNSFEKLISSRLGIVAKSPLR